MRNYWLPAMLALFSVAGTADVPKPTKPAPGSTNAPEQQYCTLKPKTAGGFKDAFVMLKPGMMGFANPGPNRPARVDFQRGDIVYDVESPKSMVVIVRQGHETLIITTPAATPEEFEKYKKDVVQKYNLEGIAPQLRHGCHLQ